ncbi:MAG: hypothetical protein HYV09_24815 [Deltaproteobacteria bacterium]|nr:hypothetical protein [Deltaproteobacteria bacterium]
MCEQAQKRQGELEGLGIWVAFAAAAGGHERIAPRIVELGARWVAPRAGEGTFRDRQWQPAAAREHVRRYHDAGLRVYPWIYSRPWSWRAEVNVFKQLVDEGADGVIIDAETPWDFGQRTNALQFMEALDKALPGVFIADAPWAYPHYHPGFPFAEFATRVNARLPQAYWSEIDNRGARFHLPRIDEGWAKFHAANPKSVRPVWPIGVTYGKEHPSKPPGAFTVDDLSFFLDRYAGKPASLYSFEAARAPTLDALRARAAAAAMKPKEP